MASAAVAAGHSKYNKVDFSVRSKLYKGLCLGTMHIRSLYDDEKIKLNSKSCCYCRSSENLSLDHLIAKSIGGEDTGDNLVYACRACNSQKNNQDLFVWYESKNEFPPINVVRRYMKLTFRWFETNDLLDCDIEDLTKYTKLYRIDLLPESYPAPDELRY